MFIDNYSKFKSIGIVCLIFQVITLFIIYNNPVTGYEVSIYSNIPILAYILLSLSIFGGFSIILFNSSNNSKLASLGFLILIFGFFIMVGLPIIKSYQFYGYADVFSHIGIEKDILTDHTISKDNWYPIMHILVTSLSLISGVSLIIISKLFVMFLSLLFVVFMYLFNSEIFDNKQKIIIASSLAIMPVLSTYYIELVPNGYSLMLVPLILYLYFKKDSISNSILLVIFLILIPFSHPLTSITLLIYFFAIEISKMIYSFFKGKKIEISFNSFFILLVTFFTWFSSSILFSRTVNQFFSWTKGELYAPTTEISNSFNKLNFTLYDRIVLFVKMYDTQVLLVLFSLIALFIILKKLRLKEVYSDQKIFAILTCIVVNIGISFLFLFTGDPNFRAIRSFYFIFMLLIPIAGYGLYEVVKKIQGTSLNKYRIINLFIICILTSCFMGGFMALYPSPYISQPSQQVSMSHLIGMEWFYENKDLNISGALYGSAAPYRFGDYIYGSKKSQLRTDVYKYADWKTVPDNFGYKNLTYLGNYFNETRYLPISSMDRLSYTEVWSSFGRYTQDDFDKLNNDKSVDKIYSSGDLDVWELYQVK